MQKPSLSHLHFSVVLFLIHHHNYIKLYCVCVFLLEKWPPDEGKIVKMEKGIRLWNEDVENNDQMELLFSRKAEAYGEPFPIIRIWGYLKVLGCIFPDVPIFEQQDVQIIDLDYSMVLQFYLLNYTHIHKCFKNFKNLVLYMVWCWVEKFRKLKPISFFSFSFKSNYINFNMSV